MIHLRQKVIYTQQKHQCVAYRTSQRYVLWSKHRERFGQTSSVDISIDLWGSVLLGGPRAQHGQVLSSMPFGCSTSHSCSALQLDNRHHGFSASETLRPVATVVQGSDGQEESGTGSKQPWVPVLFEVVHKCSNVGSARR